MRLGGSGNGFEVVITRPFGNFSSLTVPFPLPIRDRQVVDILLVRDSRRDPGGIKKLPMDFSPLSRSPLSAEPGD